MARFDRFKKLERARPDAPDEPAPQSSLRFGKIEARKDEPAAPAHDPFAPPPDDADVPLEVDDRDVLEVERQKAERAARAKAQLDAEAQRLAELRMQEEARGRGYVALEKADPILSLSLRTRGYLLGGLLVTIAVLAATVGTFMWGLAPVVIAVFLASVFAKR